MEFCTTIESWKDENDDDVVSYCEVEIIARNSGLDIEDLRTAMLDRAVNETLFLMEFRPTIECSKDDGL